MVERTYTIVGWEMTRFEINVQAGSEDEAIEQATDFYEEVHGNKHDHFSTDYEGIEEWEVADIVGS